MPIFAKYAKMRFDQIPMKRLLLKLHEPDNPAHIKKIKDLITSVLDSEGLKDSYEIFIYQDI